MYIVCLLAVFNAFFGRFGLFAHTLLNSRIKRLFKHNLMIDLIDSY